MDRNTLKELGLTDEQVDAVMKSNGDDINREKKKAETYKTEADKAAEYKKQLDEINNANLTEVEKANKERDTALSELDSLKAQIKTMELRTKLAETGITGENADKLIGGLAGGNLDVSVLAAIISERETKAANAKEKELAGNADNPGGGKVGASDNKSEAEKVAENLGKIDSASQKASADILANYIS